MKGLAERRENIEEAGRSRKEVGCSGLRFDKEAEERKDWLGEGCGCRLEAEWVCVAGLERVKGKSEGLWGQWLVGHGGREEKEGCN